MVPGWRELLSGRSRAGRRLQLLAVLLALGFVAAVAAEATEPDAPERGAAAPLARHASMAPAAIAGRRHLPPGHLRRGSVPSVLPGNVLIADRSNSRLLIVSPRGQIVWSFPRRGDLRRGQSFRVPDDAFFADGGRRIVATQEDDFVISVIDVATHRIVYRYGHPGVQGATSNHLFNPDDAMLGRGGALVSADIKNCRLISIRPPAHHVQRQLGATGACFHDPPRAFDSPNGVFPTAYGNSIVTEIGGDWADLLAPDGSLLAATHPPGFTYPSDTNEVRPGILLSVDYTRPGAIEEFDWQGRLRWRFAPTGRNALDKPSLALPLPNGDVIANDDHNDRVIVVDPRTGRIVWQYGHTGRRGRRPGFLNTPDGVDLAPPQSLLSRFPAPSLPR
jgi:hypothetical protein